MCLTTKALTAGRIARPGAAHHLDGHDTIEVRIARGPDLAHAAGANALEQLVAAELSARLKYAVVLEQGTSGLYAPLANAHSVNRALDPTRARLRCFGFLNGLDVLSLVGVAQCLPAFPR